MGLHLTLREFLESWGTPAVSQASSTESSSPPLRQPRGEARAQLETAPRESQYFRVIPDPTSQKWVLEVLKGDGSQLIPLKLCPTRLPNSMSEHGDDGERRGKPKGLLKEWDLEHRQNKFIWRHTRCVCIFGAT